MKISIIAAVAENGVIGRNNDLPWKLRDDMKFFKETTTGHVVIMGRANYDSIGRPLPNRTNIVITRDENWYADGCLTAFSIEHALKIAEELGEKEAFVIGGAQIYELALPLADTFYKTEVKSFVEGDVFFPEYNKSEWRMEELVRWGGPSSNEKNEHYFIIKKLIRIVK